jgi:hypothetical protein
MHIDEFVEITKKEIEAFRDNWVKNHNRDGEIVSGVPYKEAFPLDQDEGEWFDQFMSAETTGDGIEIDEVNNGK